MKSHDLEIINEFLDYYIDTKKFTTNMHLRVTQFIKINEYMYEVVTLEHLRGLSMRNEIPTMRPRKFEHTISYVINDNKSGVIWGNSFPVVQSEEEYFHLSCIHKIDANYNEIEKLMNKFSVLKEYYIDNTRLQQK
jgi:hypothetical protein